MVESNKIEESGTKTVAASHAVGQAQVRNIEINTKQAILQLNKRAQVKLYHHKLKRLRKILVVILYAWLFMNFDPVYTRRTLTNMVASRMLQRTLLSGLGGGGRGGRDGGNGMSTAEAIALISAINSGNNNRAQQTLPTDVNFALATRQQTALDRQLPVPVPIPTPVPTPIPPVLAPVLAALAALAALLAAALTGLNPFQAIFAVFIALIALIIAIIAPQPKGQKKAAPLIKKLVIKKTVLPFVIPIPYKQKEKEKEIIYKYVKEKKHHEHEHEHEHDHYEYKSDERMTSRGDIKGRRGNVLNKIENLMSEQDQLQNLIDTVVEGKVKADSITRRIK